MTKRRPKATAAQSAPPEAWRRLAATRSNVYGLLALVFRDAPTSQVVAQFRAPPLAGALSDLGYDAAEHLTGNLEAVTQCLRREYTRVFIGPPPRVSLYGSVHHDEEGQLWGESTVRMKRLVEGAGLSFQGNWGSIPDHIAVELELMQRLAAREAELWAQRAVAAERGTDDVGEQLALCLRAEGEVLRRHLSRWGARFCDRVVQEPTASFYREMARLTKALVLSDVENTEAGHAALGLQEEEP